ERTAEIGIRMALGAQPGQVLRDVIGQGAILAACGIAGGRRDALAVMALLSTQLYGITPLDPPTLAGVPLLLLTIAVVACFVPARRAMTIDPVNALRTLGGPARIERPL